MIIPHNSSYIAESSYFSYHALPKTDKVCMTFDLSPHVANWQGFNDAESGIYGYTWCVGTSIRECDVVPPHNPHDGLSRQAWTNTGLERSLNLSDGAYFFTVQAVSNVEYGGPLVTTVAHSTPYIVDTSPPILSEVEVIDYNVSSNQLILTYNAR